MRLRRRTLCGWLIAIGLTACSGEQGTGPAEVPADVSKALAQGINLSNWFNHRGAPRWSRERFEPTSSELRWMHAAGLRHVRVPLDPSLLIAKDDNRTLSEPGFAELRQAIETIRAAGLMTVLTLQPDQTTKAQLAEPGASAVASLAALWTEIADRLADIPAASLVFEVLNEPEIDNPDTSRAVMSALVAAVRKAAPKHTIVVAGHKYSSLPELLALTPLRVGNLVYSFHFYEPANFTHQGATWGWPMWREFAALPYPSSIEAVQPALELASPKARPHIEHYGREQWNREALAQRLDAAQRYAKKHNVVVWCSEFGAFRFHVGEDDRARWLRDVRELLTARGIGWAHWDFVDRFGIASGPQGDRSYDRAALHALGLTPPQ